MSLLFVTNDACWSHVAGRGHPERPERLTAVTHAIGRAHVSEALEMVEAPLAPLDAVVGTHTDELVAGIERLAGAGGGPIDGDTFVSEASFEAARHAAGAGLEAIDRLRAEDADGAFCAVRPPGHHATRAQAMGFCLFNNVAVTARSLAEAGERVLIVDYDAHHGNGTQDIFYRDPRVLFVSFHQWPCYPGTGAADEIGAGDGLGTTINIPLPPGATGDVYDAAWDRIAAPAIDRFGPTWLLLSAGFDAHRRDPITSMGLTAGDYVDLTARAIETVPSSRRIAFLEGGYDIEALTDSTAAVLSVLVDGAYETEHRTNGGPGREQVDAIATLHDRLERG